MTVKEIIKDFLTVYLGTEDSIMLPNHSIETRIDDYAKDNYNITHTPGTFSRAWRDIREKKKVTEWEGFIISEEKTGFKSKEKHFRIRRKQK